MSNYASSSSISSSSDEDITLTVIRTSDATRKEIIVPLSTKLGELKDDLGSEDFFGPISPVHQRLFYLGRELKTKGRSLSKLGLGRFKSNRVLHLHVQKQTPPPQQPPQQASGPTSKRRRKAKAKVPESNNNNNSAAILEILSDDNDDEVAVIENPNEQQREKRPRLT